MRYCPDFFIYPNETRNGKCEKQQKEKRIKKNAGIVCKTFKESNGMGSGLKCNVFNVRGE